MAYTEEEASKLAQINDGWFMVNSNIEVENDPVQMILAFWQFRVAIKPTRDNVLKAAQALETLEQFKKNPHPQFKIFIPAEDSELRTWDGTTKVGEQDQRGKEICVYMDYSLRTDADFYENGYPSADYLKKLMLDMWRALEKAGVEIAYITPGPGEKEILVEDGTLTPFSYSSNKPYRGRHGILHSSEYNPLKFDDPLQAVSFTGNDLKQQGITPLKAGCSAKRLSYQREHYVNGLNKAENDLQTPFKKDDVYSSVVETLQILGAKKEDLTEEEVRKFINLLQQSTDPRYQYHEPFGAIGQPGLEVFKSVGKNLEFDLNAVKELTRDQSQAKGILKTLSKTIEDERETSINEMIVALPEHSKVTRTELEQQFDRNPMEFHRLYQRFVLLAQEKQKIEQEYQHLKDLIPKSYPASYYELDKDDTLAAARNLLNDYTKSDSSLRRAFTFHWARHHTAEVKQIVDDIDNDVIKNMDELIDRLKKIELVNTKGSLSRRIDLIVCRHVDAQCQADLDIGEEHGHTQQFG